MTPNGRNGSTRDHRTELQAQSRRRGLDGMDELDAERLQKRLRFKPRSSHRPSPTTVTTDGRTRPCHGPDGHPAIRCGRDPRPLSGLGRQAEPTARRQWPICHAMARHRSNQLLIFYAIRGALQGRAGWGKAQRPGRADPSAVPIRRCGGDSRFSRGESWRGRASGSERVRCRPA
jgi:hypothetical protein